MSGAELRSGPLADVLEAAREQVRATLERAGGDPETLAKQLEFRQLTAELAAGFIGLPGDEIDSAIANALERIAKFAGAEQAVLARFDKNGTAWVVTHEWAGPGISRIRNAISGKAAPEWSIRILEAGEILHFRNVQEVPKAGARERRVWSALGLRSLMGIPVRERDGTLLGFAAFATSTREVEWPSDVFPLFDLAAEMLRSALERRRVRAELERSQLRLRNLLDAGVVGIVSADADGKIFDANDIALAVTGYSREELAAGRIRWDSLTPAEYQPLTATALEQLSDSGCSLPWEQDIYRRDGSRVSLLVCLARIAPPNESFLIYAVDITAGKQAERELALRNRLSRLITLLSTRFIGMSSSRVFEAIEDALREIGGVLGADRCAVWIDEAAPSTRSKALAVWTRPDRPHLAPADMPLLDRSRFPSWQEGFALGREVVVLDGGAKLPEGSRERHFLAAMEIVSGVAVPMMAAERPIGFATFSSLQPLAWPEATVSLLRVIGEIFAAALERARTEERRRAVHADLERRIAERTAQLENANRELEAFSHAVSHDLRAPLRTVDGFSRILVEDHAPGLPAEPRAVLDRIRSTSQRMGELIDSLLRLSRLARHEPRFQTTDLSNLAGEIVVALAAQEPGREVVFDIESGLVAEGEPRLLESLLDNLLRNAWKFTSANARAHITFATTRIEGERIFYVRDDGVGFEPSQAARVFTPFQRLHDQKQFEGHGVGLATVKRIVGVHGGRVWAEAKPGHGATIYFTLTQRT